MNIPDDRLEVLGVEDLRRVVAFVEDRFVNAVAPLSVRLQMEMPGTLAADATLQAAQGAVKRVLSGVEEARNLLHIALRREEWHGDAGPGNAKQSEEIRLDNETGNV